MTPLCDRTPQIRDAIAAQLGMPCEKVGKEDLLKIKTLELPNKGIESLRLGDFDGLENLEILRLDNNQLREIPENIFLPTKNLRELRLNGNSLARLYGRVELNGLHDSLQRLWVYENGMSFLVLENFLHLRLLNARSNKFSPRPQFGLTFGLIGLPELKYLYLSDAKMRSHDIEDGLGKLPKLEELDLSYNDLKRVIDFKERFPRLKKLDLSENKIKGIFERFLFSGVEWLNLDDNQIPSLPERLSQATTDVRLKYLSLFGNPIARVPRWLKEIDESRTIEVYFDKSVRCRRIMRKLLRNY